MTEEIKDHAPKLGRRRKGDGPAFPREEVDRLLVHGELVEADDGSEMHVTYPSFRTLAKRFGVAHSLIADYAAKHNCLLRRQQSAARVHDLADAKLAELRAEAFAVTRDDQIRAIDRFLVKFEEALEDGRVRFDNPADYNTMCRLKAYLLGDVDSRQEMTGSPFPFTLEDLQRRHAAMLARIRDSTPEERGEMAGPRGRTRKGSSALSGSSRGDDASEAHDDIAHDDIARDDIARDDVAHDDTEVVH
jgi:hypothetical protein